MVYIRLTLCLDAKGTLLYSFICIFFLTKYISLQCSGLQRTASCILRISTSQFWQLVTSFLKSLRRKESRMLRHFVAGLRDSRFRLCCKWRVTRTFVKRVYFVTLFTRSLNLYFRCCSSGRFLNKLCSG